MSANDEFLARLGASTPPQPTNAHNGSAPPASGAADLSAQTGPIAAQRVGAHRGSGTADPSNADPDRIVADAQHHRRAPAGEQPIGQPDQHPGWPGDRLDDAAATWDRSVAAGRPSPRYSVKAAALVPPRPRRSLPSRGWRKWLHKGSFGAFNVGQSGAEVELRRVTAAIKSPLVGAHTVTVVGPKGGAGKTTVTSAIASIFADVRKKDPVLAADADPTQGANLPDRIAPEAVLSFSDVVARKELHRNADLRGFVGQNVESGLDVLAGAARADGSGLLDAPTFARAHERLALYYNLLFIDTAVDFRHPVMPAVLGRTDSLILVVSAVPEGPAGAARVLDWLDQSGYERWVSRLVLVINHIRVDESRRARKETKRLVAQIREMVPDVEQGHNGHVFELPHDSHIAEGGVLELDRLAPKTHRELLRIAEAVASGFGGDGRWQ